LNHRGTEALRKAQRKEDDLDLLPDFPAPFDKLRSGDPFIDGSEFPLLSLSKGAGRTVRGSGLSSSLRLSLCLCASVVR